MPTNRKPPQKVLSIKGGFEHDVVTQAQLQEASDRQATAWLAEKNAREFVQSIEGRIRCGAKIEDGTYGFDSELQMVRSKKEKTG